MVDYLSVPGAEINLVLSETEQQPATVFYVYDGAEFGHEGRTFAVIGTFRKDEMQTILDAAAWYARPWIHIIVEDITDSINHTVPEGTDLYNDVVKKATSEENFNEESEKLFQRECTYYGLEGFREYNPQKSKHALRSYKNKLHVDQITREREAKKHLQSLRADMVNLYMWGHCMLIPAHNKLIELVEENNGKAKEEVADNA